MRYPAVLQDVQERTRGSTCRVLENMKDGLRVRLNLGEAGQVRIQPDQLAQMHVKLSALGTLIGENERAKADHA